jgi:hypothetical protein
MHPKTTLDSFDAFLHEGGLFLEATLIGGAALALLGVVERQTRDCDVRDPGLSPELLEAAKSFAKAHGPTLGGLSEDWLNNGPAALVRDLPAGWAQRRVELLQGRALCLWTLGRSDLLLTKLFALCDRGIDLQDCLALAPSADELAEARAWVEAQDTNPQWPQHVAGTLERLGRRLGHV